MARLHLPLSWLGLFLWSATLCATQSPPPPAIIHIPLTASSDNQKYFANVDMGVGTQAQRFGFALSTTTGYTIVADASCASCASNGIPTYNATQSNTAKAVGSGQQQQSVAIAGGTVNAGGGFLSKEDCALHQTNGSLWSYPNQTIIQSNASTVFSAGVSGLIGLGTNTANFEDTVFSGWFSRNPSQPNFTFGLALNPLAGTQAQAPTSSGGDPDDASASAGTLHMQQADPLSYTGDIQWQTVQGQVPSANGSANSTGVSVGMMGVSSWLIHIDGWGFTSAGAQTSNSQGGLAAVEPFFANIFLPQNQATQLYASLSGSQPLPVVSSDIGQSYSVPCNADITFGVLLSGQEYIIPKEALVLQTGNGTCTGAIEAWADASATDVLLGSRFISTVYMVFQVGRSGSPSQVGIAQRAQNAKGKTPVGAIVGGVVGGVVFFVVIGGALFWWIRRRRLRPAAPGDPQGPEKADEKAPFPPLSPQYVVDHWAPSAVPRTGATPEPYYPPVGTPSTATFSPPVSAAAHEAFFPGGHTPPGTATSETFLAPQVPKVSQWVTATGEAHGPPRPRVPTEFDYGNQGEPGQQLVLPDESAVASDGFASSTLATPSDGGHKP